jgi:hypothetical protein
MIQSHFVNSVPFGGTIVSKQAYSVLNLHAMDLFDVKHKILGMFTVNTRIAIPPHTDNWKTQRRCTFSDTVHVVAMTGHFHEQGRTFLVNQMETDLLHDTVDGVAMIGTPYCSGPDCTDDLGQAHNWDSPLFKTFDPPVLVNGDSEGFQFSCSYDNESDRWIYFGGAASTQEHCNLFFQYYIDQDRDGHLTCDEGQGGW